MRNTRIYLDYASLTPINRRVMREMGKYSSAEYANPSSLYKEGVAARKALEEARKTVAGFIHAHADEIIFTSGGTEANGLALEGVARAAHGAGIKKPHLIISVIEHSSVMETAKTLEGRGVEVTRLEVDSSGVVSTDELKKAIKPNTFLVSIMTVNNEVGTVQPIREIAKVIRQERTRRQEPMSPDAMRSRVKGDIAVAERAHPYFPLFHTDAAQALYQELNAERLGVDLLTLDGSKAYGPRGVGCLYVRRGTPIEPIICGGGQESGLRSGTENIPAVMGFAKALELIEAERFIQAKRRKNEADRLSGLRALFVDGLRKIRSDIVVNPPGASASSDCDNMHVIAHSPHILNISIPGIDNELFVLRLDAKGVTCSTKSSCLRDQDESYVLKAMGADGRNSVRFSFGRPTKERDVNEALRIIAGILQS